MAFTYWSGTELLELFHQDLFNNFWVSNKHLGLPEVIYSKIETLLLHEQHKTHIHVLLEFFYLNFLPFSLTRAYLTTLLGEE